MIEFINLKQGALKFTKLSNYASTLVADPCGRMHKFISGISNLVIKECHTTMLIKEMDISRLMTYAKQIKGEKLRERRMRDSKRARFEAGLSNSGGGSGNDLGGQRF